MLDTTGVFPGGVFLFVPHRHLLGAESSTPIPVVNEDLLP